MQPSGVQSRPIDRLRADPGAIAAWLIPFGLVIWVALQNGGYDTISRGEAGIVVWFGIAVATLVGLLPVARAGTIPKLLIGLLFAFAVWNAIALSWTESSERTAAELARAATYLGCFVLTVGLVQPGRWRQVLGGVTAAVGLIVVLAALSRLLPSLFPAQTAGDFIRDIELQSRLAYPLNYSSALAAFAAMSLPLLLAPAAFARSVWLRSLAVGAVPFATLTLWYTGSGLALPMTAIGLAFFLALTRDRLLAAATVLLAGAGGAVAILAANGREALDRGLTDSAATSQGHEMLAITLAAAVVVALLQALLVSSHKSWGPRLQLPRISPQARWIGIVAALGIALVLAIAAGVPGKVGDEWDQFRSADGLDPNQGTRTDQVLDVSTRGRYEYWQAALDAFQSEPLTGIGPGTYEFWWAREGSGEGAIFVREAHSLYLETLAELGLIGLLLIGGFVGLVVVGGTVRAVRAGPEDRPWIAAALAGSVVFAAAAAVDWMWEVGAFPIVFLILAAVVAGARGPETDSPAEPPKWQFLRERAPVLALSVLAIVVIAVPVAAESLVEDSQSDLAADQPEQALDAANDAAKSEPFAATPRVQQALVLEALGREDEAVQAAREATERESTNWRVWIVLSGIEARAGNAKEAVDAYRRANALNPRLVKAPEG